MSTTFEVYPNSAVIPTFEEIVDLSTKNVHSFLSEIHFEAKPDILVELRDQKSIQVKPIDLNAPAKWSEKEFAWFYVSSIPADEGGAHAYFEKIDDEIVEMWEGELKFNKRPASKKKLFRSCLKNDHYWTFRKTMGQPAIITLAYGMVAAAVAELTGGMIWSVDSAWEYERFPATADEFLSWYLRPELALKPEYKDWAERCIRGFSEVAPVLSHGETRIVGFVESHADMFFDEETVSKSRAIASHAVNRFHDQLNAKQYQEIYAQSEAAFRNRAMESALFEKIHQNLGQVENVKQSHPLVMHSSTGETRVELSCETSFSKGEAHEEFVYLISEDQPILREYKIHSPLLDAKQDARSSAKVFLSKLLALFRRIRGSG
jgi:hypothetical protein